LPNSVADGEKQGFGNGDAVTAPSRNTVKESFSAMPWSVYNREGQRKYLTRSETLDFLRSAHAREPAVRAFCWILAATGCRISEALALTARNIDFKTGTLIIRSLKKRGKRLFRSIPLPKDLLLQLRKWLDSGVFTTERLWPWSRMTGYRRICEVMDAAGIRGDYASPKGLRHAFGVHAVQSGIPLNLVQRWLGHADLKTTAIYANAMGPEEREIASRMWAPKSRRDHREADPANAFTCQSTTDEHLLYTRPQSAPEAGPAPVMSLRTEVTSPPMLKRANIVTNFREAYCRLRHYWAFCNKIYS